MPVHDGERHLAPALRSTLRALPRDARLLVGDDGSQDSTPRILDAAAAQDARLQVVHSEGVGVGTMLNRLLVTDSSEFVARMDADDICLPTRFVGYRRMLRNADLSFSTVVNVDDRTRPVSPDLPGGMSPAAAPLHLMLGNVLRHPTLLARREALEQLGGYSTAAAEDYDLWLRAVAAGLQIRRAPLPGLLYREHAAQVTRQARWNSEEERTKFQAVYDAAYHRAVGRAPESPELAASALAGTPAALPEPLKRSLRTRLLKKAERLRPHEQALLRFRLRAVA